MRAFLSYSLNDAEQYVLSILANKLNEQGFIVSSNYNGRSFIDFERFNAINNANLFIGVITATSHETERVFQEWDTAIQRKVPALLLLEDTVLLRQDLVNHPNIIRFNRYKPQRSIDAVKSKITPNTSAPADNIAAWALGGLAILALISLLSDRK
jgi:hypothetical protein